MRGLFTHAVTSLVLHFRNRQALVYGYIFPLLFMLAFWLVYRNEQVPLARHCGELITIGILGGACFGLPTTLVSERERGFWRYYRTAGVSPWLLVTGTVGARCLIMLSVAILQLLVLHGTGVPWPEEVLGFLMAFGLTAFGFLGLGLVIGMIADNASSVQAIGQCLFLPMLVLGGVAVPLTSLPEWAQRFAGVFPGRYGVAAIQSAFTSNQSSLIHFNSIALLAIGTSGMTAAAFLFRWDTRARAESSRVWLFLILSVWTAVGFAAGIREDRARFLDTQEKDIRHVSASWESITSRDVANLNYAGLPPDGDVVLPIASDYDLPEEELAEQLANVRARLSEWPPRNIGDPVQSVRDQLSVLAVADLLQSPVERHLPTIVLGQLKIRYSKTDLIKILTWIAQHPSEGTVITSIAKLGVRGEIRDEEELRLRVYGYSVKFVARLTGRSY